MIGVIHQLFFGFVEKNFGAAAVATVKQNAGLAKEQAFRMDASYSDEEWQRILTAAVKLSGLPAEQAELAFARYCGEWLHANMAGFFKGVSTTRDLILRQPNIHNMMASSVQDAGARQRVLDKFRVEQTEGGTVTHYASPNHHCTLYRGLVEWAAEKFKERVEVSESRCQKRGDPECEIRVKYLGKA
jgi:hypothetical protein